MAITIHTSPLSAGEIDQALLRAKNSIQTINGIAPDENGNIEITVGSGSGGGGGGGESNNAVLTLQNTTGWIYKVISEGTACPVQFNWSSIENELETGSGVLKITVNGSVKYTAQINQGTHTYDLAPYLSAGTNSVRVNITDVYGNSRTITFSLSVVALRLESSFDPIKAYSGDIVFPYVPTAAISKTVYFKMDGNQIGTAVVAASGRQQTFTIPAQSHGVHTFEVYFEAVIDGETVPSNRLVYNLVCVEEGNMTPVIAVSLPKSTVEQYENTPVYIFAYDPANLTATISLSSTGSDAEPTERTVDRTQQVWNYLPYQIGSETLTVTCVGSDTSSGMPLIAVVSVGLTVTESSVKIEAETSGLSLHLSSIGRSNAEANPSTWSYGDVEAELTGFNFTSDGWVQDEDGITVLRVSGDARVEIPVKPFSEDFRTLGKTIELEFASRNVLNYDAVIFSCMSGGRGLEVTAQQAFLTSAQSTIGTRYKEDEHVRLSFVVEKRSGNRLLLCYINGIMSGAVQYPDGDDFAQVNPVNISIGSNECTVDLYNIRVYEGDLNRYQILENWIADTQVATDKVNRWKRNDIYDEYSTVVLSKLPTDLPYLIIKCPVLPAFKGDKKTCSGSYVDPVNPKKSFTFENAEIDVQGTSSQYYYVKNFKIKFKGGFILWNGASAETYQLNDNVIATNTYTFKADVASSEGANNVVLAKLYNDLNPAKTPPQLVDPKVRQTIDGHPIVMFWDDGVNTPTFAGKYNFNHDKGTAEVFGFSEGDESWEILQNGTDRVGWHNPDFSGDGWKADFEARYPEDNTDTTNLAAFATWLASTDVTAVSSDEEKAARLAKFKDELPDHADVDSLIFYYLFTFVFLCIDQREKNAFPTLYKNADGKWIVLFYDADSSLGTDNKGNLAFDYYLEDIDYTEGGDPIFNGQNSVLWYNLRNAYFDEIKAEYKRWRTELRPDGRPLLSYDIVDETFDNHQSKWTEAIFNEDGYKKSIEPMVLAGDTTYIPMLQGKKEHHRKWWLYNRFRYSDSMFETGTSMTNRILMRARSKGDITLKSYVTMYGRVYYNSEMVGKRMLNRGQEYSFPWAASGAEDAVIGINDADMITSLGDLSPLKLEEINVSGCRHLTYLKVGDSASDYSNTYLNSVTLGNNPLLQTFDARNCVNLTQSIDFSGCTNIEHIYLDGTAIAGATLPNGGILKTLHYPATVTDLTIRNQTALTDVVLPSYSQIETLRVENCNDKIPVADILAAIAANSRVRLIGFDWSFDSAEDILTLYDRLDTMRGLDEKNETTSKPQMQGTVRVSNITGTQLAEMKSRYSSINVVYEHITSNLYFYNDTGTTLLYTASVVDGADATYGGSTPTKTSTAQYTFGFSGNWSITPGGPAVATALKNVTSDRNVYAVFTATVRTYTVTWKNGSTTLETDSNVPYGTVPTYDGSTPVYTGTDADDWEFSGWSPAVAAITGNTTYTAQFRYNGYISVQLMSGTLSGDYVNETVKSVGYGAFYACNNLTSVTLNQATSIGQYAFSMCRNLVKLVIKTPTVCSLGSYAFNGSGISLSEGYIYVPKTLLESYKSASNWSTYANQIRAMEDYPEMFLDTWGAVMHFIDNGTYASMYSIGDIIPLDLGSEGVIDMQVTAFDTDDLADGSGKAPITFTAKELLKTSKRMNPSVSGSAGSYVEGTGAIGGWGKCEMRTYLIDTIKPLIAENVRNRLMSVTKKQNAYDATGTVFAQTTIDDIWIPSLEELDNGIYKELYPNNSSRCKYKNNSTSYGEWRMRSADTYNTFYNVRSDDGYASGSGASFASGVCIGFCLGRAKESV